MKIEILGGCRKLFCDVLEALRECGITGKVVKIEDHEKIRRYRVTATPALVINGEVKCLGKMVSQEEIEELLKEAA